MTFNLTKIKAFVFIYMAACTVFIFAAEKPNIILIISDDIAWNDVGPEGNRKLQAPNIDRMAREGMWNDRAFLTIASCSPSRSSIISGRYPHNTDAEQLHWPMPGSHMTFVKALKEAGYWTGAAGKWHLGEDIKAHFDEVREADISGYKIPSGAKGGYRNNMKGEAASGASVKLTGFCTTFITLASHSLPSRSKRIPLLPTSNRPSFLEVTGVQM